MRKQIAALVIAGSAVAGMFAAPAAHAADTSTTFVLSAAGGLSISVPASATLSSGTATNAGTLTASLGAVSVSDLRGALLTSWTATVTSGDFSTGGATSNEKILKANVAYWSGAATATSGTGVFTPGQATSLLAAALSTGRTAYAATAAVGNNSATWDPTVVVTIPSAAVVGTYSGTITHSAA
ncbi:MAG: hypothetical protein QOI55_2368 [Actinomycetota bacterium]|jgi:hypothetical protein|nr:hypothetical protein [Actinomycetota bacterium]